MKRINNFLFSILFLVLVISGGKAYAQGSSDAAPGTAGAPVVNAGDYGGGNPAGTAEKKTAPLASVPTGNSFLSNGDFSKTTRNAAWPDDWPVVGDLPVSLQLEEGKHFLRFDSQSEGQLVQVARVVSLPQGLKGVEFFARFRTANVKFGKGFTNDARLVFRFEDVNGQKLSSPGDVIFDSHAKEWTTVSRKFLMPSGAVTLKIIPGLNRPKSGTLDLQEIQLYPMSATEADAMIAEGGAKVQAHELAVKRNEQLAAQIPADLQLPALSPELKVSGNKLVNAANGETVILQGVNVCSLEWSAKGEQVLLSVKVAIDEWKANAIRLPVNDDFWFGRGRGEVKSNDAEAYRKIVDDVIKLAAAKKVYVILDLHRFHIPEQSAVDFWQDAAARYKNNPVVLFDMFNEPTGVTWEQWRNGGDVSVKQKDKKLPPLIVKSPGMQGILESIRATGAKNVVVAGGVGYAYDLSGLMEVGSLDDKGGNGVVYATHFYNWHGGWEQHFLKVAEKYPVLVGEFGADEKKMSFIPANKQEDPYTWSPDALAMVQKYQLSWTAFCLHPKSTPRLINSWDYDPTPFWGQFVKDALAGKKFELKALR